MAVISKKMRNIGKKLNEKVLEGRNVSDKLPEFKKTRKGTEIYIIDGQDKIRIYDDYSMYPESTATKWRVRIYNIETGYFYDKSTMCNGLYFTRERALAEIDRFKNRAENLIFYVLPISFSYNKEKLSEDIENEYYDYETPVYSEYGDIWYRYSQDKLERIA